MNISVILCTFNRCRLLQAALESAVASRMPPGTGWEVLVVDNNSKDQTREVVEDFSRRYPGRFRYLFEGRPGKSYALNTGIAAAKGDVLAFMDDDVTVDPEWLQSLVEPLRGENLPGLAGVSCPVGQPIHRPGLHLRAGQSRVLLCRLISATRAERSKRVRSAPIWPFRGGPSSSMADFESIWDRLPTMRFGMKTANLRDASCELGNGCAMCLPLSCTTR